ncbi:hypothetical protein Tcan_11753 [Toxocara canis]|uniref:Secreted protein n=1 Tax=Toxocara canis TaxID=6265 RepID=A0A0B2UR51_TOXCA|nr:hypothetical protein Tcan_11753 [Toxocara canis]
MCIIVAVFICVVPALIQGYVNVDPINFRFGNDIYGRPQVDLGAIWNFFGYGFGANTDWTAGPGSFSSTNINSIFAPGGPYSFGSFFGWPIGKKK